MQDATALARAIAAGDVSPRAAMAASLDRASLVPGAVVRRLDPGAAFAAAEAAETVLARLARRDGGGGGETLPPASAQPPVLPPFIGVPFLGKDLGAAAAGLAPAGGCAAIRARVDDPAEDSALFARFRAGGLVPFGLTAVPELGLGLATPGCANPFDADLSCGGSSGGAALAVASGIVAIAHATDAGGSIRVPASCCGLWGLKPSRGAIPQGPDYGNHLMGLASELVLARSLRDVETAFALAADAPLPAHANPASPEDAETPKAPPLRFAICIPPGTRPANAAVTHAVAAALARLGAVRISGEAEAALAAAFSAQANAAGAVAAQVFALSAADWLDALAIPDAELSPLLRAFRARGRAIPGPEVFALSRRIAAATDAAAALFGEVDAILSPTLSGPPPAMTAYPPDEPDPDARALRMAMDAPLVAHANVAGLPALAFPAGSLDGVPIGLQLTGPHGSEAALLALAAPLTGLHRPSFPPIAGLPT
ncbi:amidase family protein [Rhodovulum sp. DZ06]|uniref:amidase family protein n=1 Tax=Rhodovulum sp. DZ06 TaxID=3425126 RepID=UPI003D328019